MATYPPYVNYSDPETRRRLLLKQGQPPQGAAPAPAPAAGGAPLPYLDTNDADKMARDDRARAAIREQQLWDQSANRMAGQSGLEEHFRTKAYSEYDPILQGKGGYSPQETAAILGDPGAERKFFDPESQQAIEATGAAGQRGAVGEAQQRLSQVEQDPMLSFSPGYLDELNRNAGGAADTMTGAATSSTLGLDPAFAGRYLMTPQEEQDYVSSAGQDVNAHYAGAINALTRRSQAEGSGAPGEAAMRLRAEREMAGAAGEAQVGARIAAGAERARRAGGYEGMRLGAAQTQAGMEMSAAERGAGLRERALTTGEQMREESARYLANLASENARWTGAQKAGTEGEIANRAQGVAKDIRDFGAGQQRYIDTTQSERAAAVAAQKKKEEAEARGFVTGEQAQASQNYNAAAGQQLQGEGATGGLESQATSSRTSSHLGGMKQPGIGQQAVGAGLGALAALTGAGKEKKMAEGGVVTQPTLATLGERGPEAVVPIRRSRFGAALSGAADAVSEGGEDQGLGPMAGRAFGGAINALRGPRDISGGPPSLSNPIDILDGIEPPTPMAEGSVITKPTTTLIGERGPEMVVPLNGQQGAKVPPRFAGTAAPAPGSYLGAAAPRPQSTQPAFVPGVTPQPTGPARFATQSQNFARNVWRRPGTVRPAEPSQVGRSTYGPLRPVTWPGSYRTA